MTITCNTCNNPLGELKQDVLKIKYNRVFTTEHDLKNASTTLQCRKCCSYSIIKYKNGKLTNTIDHKRSSLRLLG